MLKDKILKELHLKSKSLEDKLISLYSVKIPEEGNIGLLQITLTLSRDLIATGIVQHDSGSACPLGDLFESVVSYDLGEEIRQVDGEYSSIFIETITEWVQAIWSEITLPKINTLVLWENSSQGFWLNERKYISISLDNYTKLFGMSL